MSFQEHFARALAAAPGRLHFAAHSHHLWPDVTREAHARAWEDAARLADRKWERVFGEVLPAVRAHVARTLRLSDAATLAVGTNTHELVQRVLSCFEEAGPLRVLTTDAEFHSFRRQSARLEEAGRLVIERVPTEPFESFPARFGAAARRGRPDLVFFSHVFFNSGYVVPDLQALVEAAPEESLVVIDGYHGFWALPTDLSGVEGRAFYVAGGYKYAMSGEGACFLHCPSGVCARPLDTGWFAGFDELEGEREGPVTYAPGGARFLGATFDPAGFYRFRAVMDWLTSLGLSVADVHAHVVRLQARFLELLAERPVQGLAPASLLPSRGFEERGHFLTFRTARAAAIHGRLLEHDVITDFRGDRLRLGFGLYHVEEDVERLHGRLVGLLG